MDVGDKILEKIEEYFGRRVTKALLLIVMLAIFVLALDTVSNYALMPATRLVGQIIDFFNGGPITFTADDIVHALVFAGVAIALLSVTSAFVGYLGQKWIRRNKAEMDALLEQLKKRHFEVREAELKVLKMGEDAEKILLRSEWLIEQALVVEDSSIPPRSSKSI